jgi:mannose-6-phosphate isomerase-like protein (cupin superfamily)
MSASGTTKCVFSVFKRCDNVLRWSRVTTEVYYILTGTGKIELNDDWHEIGPGTTIWIEPGTRHRVVSELGIATIVFGLPAFNPSDEWFD